MITLSPTAFLLSSNLLMCGFSVLIVWPHSCQIIPYSVLLSALDMSNLRELEDLIIDCIYAGTVFFFFSFLASTPLFSGILLSIFNLFVLLFMIKAAYDDQA